jgi:hypothetical protein
MTGVCVIVSVDSHQLSLTESPAHESGAGHDLMEGC